MFAMELEHSQLETLPLLSAGDVKRVTTMLGSLLTRRVVPYFKQRRGADPGARRRDVAMTGEIDTHGRVTAVGGLDVKLETAASAGCKTVIIPRENLHRPGDIERFPEALRRELQVLTYEQWQGAHEPCDLVQHVLPVVAVDDIVQAHHVAVIYELELAAVETQFAAHARSVARELALRERGQRRGVLALVVKDLAELPPGLFPDLRPYRFAACRHLVAPEVLPAIASHPLTSDPLTTVAAFDPDQDDLGRAEELLARFLNSWIDIVKGEAG